MSENVSSASKLLTKGLRGSVAVDKHHDQNSLGKKGFSNSKSYPITAGRQGRNLRQELREGTEAKPVLLTASLSLFSAYLDVGPPTSGLVLSYQSLRQFPTALSTD